MLENAIKWFAERDIKISVLACPAFFNIPTITEIWDTKEKGINDMIFFVGGSLPAGLNILY